mgnify:CR=1 FL=1|tara:strand:- start:1971 stop:2402 length:432 start_codon:yes stop_codon:yes gene_type:complete
MAVIDYGVTSAQVVEHLPFDSSQISPTSKPLSTADIDNYFIPEANATITGMLDKAGIDQTALDDDSKQQMQSAIINYCVMRSLLKIGQTGPLLDQAREQWDSALKWFGDRPSIIPARGVKATSNIDTSTNKIPAKFSGINFQF